MYTLDTMTTYVQGEYFTVGEVQNHLRVNDVEAKAYLADMIKKEQLRVVNVELRSGPFKTKEFFVRSSPAQKRASGSWRKGRLPYTVSDHYQPDYY